MKRNILVILVVFLTLIILCFIKYNKSSKTYFGSHKDTHVVEISEVLNNPESYDGKVIIVQGYLYAGFEMSGVYENKYSRFDKIVGRENKIINEVGICVNLANITKIGNSSSIKYPVNGKKVILIGQYSSDYNGHLGNCKGRVDNVYSLVLL